MRHLTRREWLSRSAAAAAVWSVGGFDHLLAQGEGTLADTAHGRIRGMRVDGVHIFKGVPYRRACDGRGPVHAADRAAGVDWCARGGHRGPRAIQGPANIFMNPLIGKYFSGGRSDRQALSHQEESENCLNLNVLTPALTGRRAVMVYVHGGGFAQAPAS